MEFSFWTRQLHGFLLQKPFVKMLMITFNIILPDCNWVRADIQQNHSFADVRFLYLNVILETKGAILSLNALFRNYLFTDDIVDFNNSNNYLFINMINTCIFQIDLDQDNIHVSQKCYLLQLYQSEQGYFLY